MNILLGVTGSIAAYKSFDLARALVKNGHQVKVVLTRGALEFVKPEVYRYLGCSETYMAHEDFSPEKLNQNQNVLHIELSRWADKIVIAPLSLNTMGRMGLGLCDDLLVSLLMASQNTPTLLFPAMNTEMWNHKRTQEHLQNLKKNPQTYIFHPSSGELVCGEVGEGKLPAIESIIKMVETYTPGQEQKKSIIITAGATVSPLDPVRFLTNPSSGKMGLSVAEAFLKMGYQVHLLCGYQCSEEVEFLRPHPRLSIYSTPTTELMYQTAQKLFEKCDLYISTGAIADIEFKSSETKIKKEQMSGSLQYYQAKDVLGELLPYKKSSQKVVSFAAETELSNEIFQEKLQRKPVDLMVANKVHHGIGEKSPLGFKVNEGEYYFLNLKENYGPYHLSKKSVGEKLVHWFESGSLS